MADYGRAHRKLRARWAPLIAGGQVLCARCEKPIHPYEHWDLGHADDHSGRYNGPEHRTCNRSAGGWKRWHPNPPATHWAL
jgi:hypothetical protein